MRLGTGDSQLELIPLASSPPAASPARSEPWDRPAVDAPRAAENLPKTAASAADDAIWLDGETLLCRCPDCGAPMSIRLWLLVADCWQCGASLELSEEQERQIERLLADRVAARREPPAPAAKPTSVAPPPELRDQPRPPENRATPPAPASPAQTPRSPAPPLRRPAPPASPAPAPLAAPLAAAVGLASGAPAATAPRPAATPASREAQHNWLRDWLKETPAWLVSLIIHLIMLLLLALWDIPDDRRDVSIVLSTAVGRDRVEGEQATPIDAREEPAFDLPLPDNIDLADKRVRETMLAADQAARELQLDPDLPAPTLADLAAVRELAKSDDPVRRSLAVRDPRLRVEVVAREGGTTLTEAAVARGLRWLARQQKNDGRWSERGGLFENAETALALLPFLGAGQTHHTGRYKNEVAKGLRWLLRHQKENGDLRGGEAQHPGMYAHGIASIVLCDAFAMTGDEALRSPAQRAVDFIVAAQSADGGWRYFPKQDSDLSVVGWQLMALQSARMSGLTVPPETLEMASRYLDKVGHLDGAVYSYQHRGGEARPTPAMTAEGLLCRMYLGWGKDEPSLAKGVGILRAEYLPKAQERNVYYWYYGTQVFHHFGGDPWRDWNERMRDLLVDSQVSVGPNAGSWNPDGDRWGSAGGRIFMTSLAVCSLEVYYRHAPIYRQLDLTPRK